MFLALPPNISPPRPGNPVRTALLFFQKPIRPHRSNPSGLSVRNLLRRLFRLYYTMTLFDVDERVRLGDAIVEPSLNRITINGDTVRVSKKGYGRAVFFDEE